jgi:hypothetical protein
MNNADFKSLHLRVLKAPLSEITVNWSLPQKKKSEMRVAMTEPGTKVLASRGTKAARRASVLLLLVYYYCMNVGNDGA